MSTTGQGDEPVVTREMIGLFVVFGGDLILLVVLLAIVGVASWTVALAISAVVLAVFGGWAGHRWRRLRDGGERTDRRSSDDESADALDTLKSRYAAGELGDEEFEEKLDRLLESDRVADEATNVTEMRSSGEDESTEERT